MNNQQRNRRFYIMIVLSLWIIILLLTGCSKINRENYNKIKIGMEYEEVVSILGNPVSCESVFSAKTCLWGKDPKTISIQFISDQVILLSAKGL